MKTKRIISILLCALMLFGSIVMAEEEIISEESAEVIFEEESHIPEEIELETEFLSAMNILPDVFDFSETITREEAAILLIRMLGKEDSAMSQMNLKYYSDVEEYSVSSGFINAATTEGLFTGSGDGAFRPASPLTFPEFSKLLVIATGYGIEAEKKGGFPSGYLSVALKLKILKNVISDENTYVTWHDAIQMVYNTMEVDVLSATGFLTNNTETVLSKEKGNNILMLNHGIYKAKGQITGTSISKMFGVGSSRELEVGQIEINGHLLSYDEERLSHLALLTGYRTEYYYRKDDSGKYEYELIYAYIEENTSVEIYSYDIIETYGFDLGDTESPYIKFYIDDKRRTERLSVEKTAALIVNNKAVPRIQNSDLFPSCGKVTLIDSDKNSRYDVVVVLNYDTKVVDTVSIHGKHIYFKATAGEDQTALKPLVLNPDFNDVTYNITKNGKNISLREIKEGDVIGIIEGVKDKKPHYTIELITSAFEGAISEIGTEEALVDGKSYKVAEGFNLSSYMVELNEPCKIYLNYAKEVFFVEKTEIEYDFQYLLIGAAKKGNFGRDIQIKVVYAPHFIRHDVLILDCAEKVKVNGKKLSGTAILDALRLNPSDSAEMNKVLEVPTEFMQPIRSIEFDSEGKVNKIDILSEGAKSTVKIRTYLGEGPYNEAFDDYKISYLTQFFYIPRTCRDEDWTYGELERLKFGEAKYYTMMWGSDSEGLPEVVMIFHQETSRNPSYGINYKKPMLVDSVKTIWNAEKEEPVYRITTYNSGGVFVYESDTRNAGNQNFDDLKPGDVIFAALTQLETDTIAKVNVILGGNMWNCVRDIRLSDKSLSYFKASNTMYGVVDTIRTDIRKNKSILNMYFGDDGYQSYDISGVPIYYFDRGENKATLASYAAIRSREHYGEEGASNVYVWLNEYLNPAMIVIIGEK